MPRTKAHRRPPRAAAAERGELSPPLAPAARRVPFTGFETFMRARRATAVDRIDVYALDLDVVSCGVNQQLVRVLDSSLDAVERQAVNRLRRGDERRRQALMRGAVRLVLGAYLERPPRDVPLARDRRGAPRVLGCDGPERLHVSTTRAAELGLIAVSTEGAIGVDLEVVAEQRFPDDLSEHMLSPSELGIHAGLPRHARSRWLARTWVAKEAVLKALGRGLEVDPRLVDVQAPSDRDCHAGGWRPIPWRSSWWLYEVDRALAVAAIAASAAAPVEVVELTA